MKVAEPSRGLGLAPIVRKGVGDQPIFTEPDLEKQYRPCGSQRRYQQSPRSNRYEGSNRTDRTLNSSVSNLAL